MSRLPQLKSAELVAFFRRQGFADDRQTGSHLTLLHPDGRRVTVPVHSGADLGRGLAVRILKDGGYTVDDYLRLR
ncbi:MAG: type II toxin-antitoxin system HicA family toxin [Dehalococcoidia bacterium]|nr:type II toxin-antitoxin system HicA family toxin [Dehalococcoidia bacterium]